DVDVIVFWTRNPRPLLPYLDELDQRGYRYYFQYTLLDYPRPIETSTPPVAAALETFRALAERVGPQRVIWRYDPLLFSTVTGAGFHQATFERLAASLHGYTQRVVISVLTHYPKLAVRFQRLAEQGVTVLEPGAPPGERFESLMRSLAEVAHHHDLDICSCASELDLQPYGICPDKCIDDAYIARVFGLQVGGKKDPSQRKFCGCVLSRDIGMYDSCPFGCQYCYATTTFERARANHAQHNPQSPSLLGWHDIPPASNP
ncbi:MAG: DUF1848 domain-containing protein, partial [Anaerolineales bacterium]|nr:DUF1848 domain-containing protein [Anaerolineales bacterium]